MGSLKTGDLIIVTEVLVINLKNIYSIKAKNIINTTHKIKQVDCTGCPFPYKIEVGNSTFWVEGVPYSSLMMELV